MAEIHIPFFFSCCYKQPTFYWTILTLYPSRVLADVDSGPIVTTPAGGERHYSASSSKWTSRSPSSLCRRHRAGNCLHILMAAASNQETEPFFVRFIQSVLVEYRSSWISRTSCASAAYEKIKLFCKNLGGFEISSLTLASTAKPSVAQYPIPNTRKKYRN